MKNCKSCGKELDKSAKICPNCGKDQRNWFMKHKILTGILVLIIMTTLGGSSSTEETSSTSNADTEKKTEETNNTSNADTEKKEEQKEEKITLKVNSVTDWNDPQGFQSPDSGNKYVEVNFDITNNTIENGISMNQFYFSAETETATVDPSFVVSDNQPDSELKIKSGVTKTYDLIFEIPQNDKIIEFTYNNLSNKISTKVNY